MFINSSVAAAQGSVLFKRIETLIWSVTSHSEFKIYIYQSYLNHMQILHLFLTFSPLLPFLSPSLQSPEAEGPVVGRSADSFFFPPLIFFSAWEAVVDLMSESEMAALIKLVWLAEIGSLLLGKENRKALHKQRKMALAEQKNSPVWCDLVTLERYQLRRGLHTHAVCAHHRVQRYKDVEINLMCKCRDEDLY